jgi:hypothetical protein
MIETLSAEPLISVKDDSEDGEKTCHEPEVDHAKSGSNR